MFIRSEAMAGIQCHRDVTYISYIKRRMFKQGLCEAEFHLDGNSTRCAGTA